MQLIDAFTARVLRMMEQQDPILDRVRELKRGGASNKKIGLEVGWHPLQVGKLLQLDDPTSALSLRVKGVREDKERKAREKAQQLEQRRIAKATRGNLAEMRKASVSEPVQYERFLARERGDPIPGARIPLLDYSEEDQAETERVERRSWRQRFRQLGRTLLPVNERVEILVEIARTAEDPADRMKALHELHSIEGAIKKPTAEVRGTGGPLFSIPGGLPIQVAPVGPAPLPTREDETGT